jgi:heme exporter protein CcmD
MSEHLAMGGYGAYVWSCMALTLIVLVVCTLSSMRRQRRIFDDIQKTIRSTETVR